MEEALEVVPMDAGGQEIACGLGVRRGATPSDRMARRHAHAFHQVTLILSSPGRVEWYFAERPRYSGRPAAGDVMVCPAFVPTFVRWERPFESISIRLSTELLDRVAERIGLGRDVLQPAAMRRDQFAEHVARTITDDLSTDRPGRAVLAESLGTALAVHLLREYGDQGIPTPRSPARLPDGSLRLVTDYIEAHLDSDLRVDRLAGLAGVSPYHFIRLFRGATGTTPHQYVLRRRVERARELLLAGSGIAEAAARVGFSSQSHLHRHIRRLLGVTPGALAEGRVPSPGRPRPPWPC